MATSADMLCEICKEQNITQFAENFCPECAGGLCSKCKIHHGISKFTKGHETITIENYHQLPPSVLLVANHCTEHEKVYTHYCVDHECLCCALCLSTDHKKCFDFKVVDDIVNSAKTSFLLESVEKRAANIKEYLTKILKKKLQNLDTNKYQRESILNKIKKIRMGLKTHLDDIENEIVDNLTDVDEKIKLDIETFTANLTKKRESLEELERDINTMKTFASNFQTCLASIKFMAMVDEDETYLESLQKTDQLTEKVLTCDINDPSKDVKAATQSFGTVFCEEIPFELDLPKHKHHAQTMFHPTHSISRSIDGLSLTLKHQWKVSTGDKKCSITGCLILQDERIILVDRDFNNKIIILTGDGKLEKEIEFTEDSHPTDVTCIEDNTICLSFNNNHLEIIDTKSYKTSHCLPTSNRCCGITSDKGRLIWYEMSNGIQLMELPNDTTSTIFEDDSVDYWSYITVFDNHIYQTRCRESSVTCYKINGDKVWEFKDESIIQDPLGIAVDNHSNVYIASEQDKVVMLCPNGMKSRQILSKEDGLDNPHAIYFDRQKDLLLITNKCGHIFLYNFVV